MNEEEIKNKLKSIEENILLIREDVHRMRKYQIIQFTAGVVLFLLPLIAIIFSVPFLLSFLSSYGEFLP